MTHVDGNRACSAWSRPFREGRDNLQEALGPDDVVAEVRAKRVSAPGGTSDLVAALPNQSVVHDGNEGLIFR
ncbi:hypothetical protein D3C72_1115380 [compost metagenome]